MTRFLIIAVIVAIAVVAVLHFTGYDILAHVTGKEAHDVAPQATDFSPTGNPHFMNNLIAGIASGLIVAVITGMFARR